MSIPYPLLDADRINALGIPVDSLTLDDAVERILCMAKCRDGRARLVSTLNVDFLVNSLGTLFSKPRHPELLDVLRNSDLVTADGFPIVWLSKILRRPLPGRVCGSDLVPALAARAAREGLSLFLLGGAEGVAAEAAKILESRFPALRIAGTAAPMVITSGTGLRDAEANDKRLLAEIHASSADILLVGLGNPKQELWFNRNRRRLKTPVAIGVGGSFEFITGTVRRAPRAWQALNMEWLYRITQDPIRLWKRYSKGLLKLCVLAAPAIAQRAGDQFRRRVCTGVEAIEWRRLWSSREQSIALHTLPAQIDGKYLRLLAGALSTHNTEVLRILDFSRVTRMSLDAQHDFFGLAAVLRALGDSVQVLGVRPGLRRQLGAARLLNLIRESSHSTLDSLGVQDKDHAAFSCRSYCVGNSTLILLSGWVEAEALRGMGFVECALHGARQRDCILDFRGVTMLESSGIAELIPLLTLEQASNTRVLLSGLSHSTRQMLRHAGVELSAEPITDSRLLGILAEG